MTNVHGSADPQPNCTAYRIEFRINYTSELDCLRLRLTSISETAISIFVLITKFSLKKMHSSMHTKTPYIVYCLQQRYVLGLHYWPNPPLPSPPFPSLLQSCFPIFACKQYFTSGQLFIAFPPCSYSLQNNFDNYQNMKFAYFSPTANYCVIRHMLDSQANVHRIIQFFLL